MSAAGLERVKDFSWESFSTEIVRHAKDAMNAYQERSAKQQEAGSVEEAERQGEHLRQDEGADSTEKAPVLAEGNNEVDNGQETQDVAGPQEEEV